MLSSAFEVLTADINNVLLSAKEKLLKTDNLEELSKDIYQQWTDKELERIAQAALEGREIKDQLTLAYAEIETILVEEGVITP